MPEASSPPSVREVEESVAVSDSGEPAPLPVSQAIQAVETPAAEAAPAAAPSAKKVGHGGSRPLLVAARFTCKRRVVPGTVRGPDALGVSGSRPRDSDDAFFFFSSFSVPHPQASNVCTRMAFFVSSRELMPARLSLMTFALVSPEVSR